MLDLDYPNLFPRSMNYEIIPTIVSRVAGLFCAERLGLEILEKCSSR